jgi:hypothetical protein
MADAGLSPTPSDLEQLLQQELAALSSRSDSLCTSADASQLCIADAGENPQLQHRLPRAPDHSLI